MGIPTASPGNIYGKFSFYYYYYITFYIFSEMPYLSPGTRQPGSTFPGSFLGPSPGTPANATITSAPTPSNNRSDETSTNLIFLFPTSKNMFPLGNKQTSTLHSYNRHLYTKHYPVYMSQQTFFRMLFTPDGHQWSKFESFLASSVLVRHFARAVSEPVDLNNPTVN
jgi:hypothetical protein